MDSNEEIAPRPLPSWLSIPIILLCLGGGGWIIHWYVMTDSLAEQSKVRTDAGAPAANNQRPSFRRQGGMADPNSNFGTGTMRTTRDGGYIIRGNRASATAYPNDGRLRLVYNSNGSEFAGDDWKTLEAAQLLLRGHDSDKLKRMKVTSVQLAQVQAQVGQIEMAATPQQRTQILDAFKTWQAAADTAGKQAAYGRIRQLIDQTAAEDVPATRVQIAQRAQKVNTIITPEQWKIDADMGGGK